MPETRVSAAQAADPVRDSTAWRIGTAVMVAAILTLRCWVAYTHPVLWGDDWDLFVRFIAAPGPGAVFQPYAGYVSVVPSSIGWLASNFASGSRPFILAWAAAGVGIAALSWFASPRFAHLIPDVRQRSLVCVLLALAPISNSALLSTTMFSSWHLLFILALATVARAPTQMPQLLGELMVLALCIFSHPLSFVLVPLFGWRASIANTARARGYFCALTVTACLYFLGDVDSAGVRVRDWGRTAMAALEMLTHRVVGGSVLHGNFRTEVPVSLGGFALLLVPLIVVAVAARRADANQPRDLRGGLLGLLYVAVALIVMTTLGRFDAIGKLLQSPRYTYVPTLCWYLVVMITLLAAVRTCTPRLRALAVFGLVLHTAALNDGQGYLYRTSPATGDRVLQFAAGIDAWLESVDGADQLTLPLPGRRLNVTRPRR